MVYKLVEVDGIPVEKRSLHKESHGGRKQALRLAKSTGTVVEEVVHPFGYPTARGAGPRRTRTDDRHWSSRAIPSTAPDLESARERVKEGLLSLPWDGLKLSRGEPAIPTRMIAPASH